jgi:hypothetical protein
MPRLSDQVDFIMLSQPVSFRYLKICTETRTKSRRSRSKGNNANQGKVGRYQDSARAKGRMSLNDDMLKDEALELKSVGLEDILR